MANQRNRNKRSKEEKDVEFITYIEQAMGFPIPYMHMRNALAVLREATEQGKPITYSLEHQKRRS